MKLLHILFVGFLIAALGFDTTYAKDFIDRRVERYVDPDLRQNSDSSLKYSCGPVSVLIADSILSFGSRHYSGAREVKSEINDLLSLRGRRLTGTVSDGTNAHDLKPMLTRLGRKSRILPDLPPERALKTIESHVKNNGVVIVGIKGRKMGGTIIRGDDPHGVVIYYVDSNVVRFVNSSDGRQRSVSRDEFASNYIYAILASS